MPAPEEVVSGELRPRDIWRSEMNYGGFQPTGRDVKVTSTLTNEELFVAVMEAHTDRVYDFADSANL